jgi:hypothetical protein
VSVKVGKKVAVGSGRRVAATVAVGVATGRTITRAASCRSDWTGSTVILTGADIIWAIRK